MPLRHPNAEVARRLWSAIAEGDPEELRDVLAPGVVWRSAGQSPMSGEYFGPKAVMQYLAEVGERADELVSSLAEIFVNPDGAVVVHRLHARRGSKVLEMDYMIRFRVVDKQVVSALSVPVDQAKNDAFWS